MKPASFILATLLSGASACAQGTINFVNRIDGVLDSPVYWGELGHLKLNNPTDGHWWVAVLYASAPGGTLAPVGEPIPFRGGVEAGYWPGETRTIPGVAERGTAQLQVRVFCSHLGVTFEEVAAIGTGDLGVSETLSSVTTGDASNPAPMLGLSSFSVSVYIPEPSTAALGVLGIGVFLLWRRK